MPFISGWVRVRQPGHPDHDLPEGPGGSIDNSLPGDQPGIDNGLPPGVPPLGSTLPVPPPGIWPPPSFTRPIVPAGPDNSLPVTPGTIWPSPGRPNRPDNSLPGGGGGHPDQGLPSQTFWVVAGIPGLGWRYIAVDPSLEVGGGPAPTPEPR